MNILVHIIRIFTGITFVYSGFVKLVDPLGSQYKFEEYFSEGVLNMEFLIPYALQFSILLIIAEVMLGILLLLGYLSKFTTRAIFLLTLLFLFLTFYSWYFDVVKDCGCFGDAIKLTAFETFIKNIVLIVFTILLMIKYTIITPILSIPFVRGVAIASLLVCSGIVYNVLHHLPLIDFRAYAIGKNIVEGMEEPEDFNEDPKVKDFFLESMESGDLTEDILAMDKVVLVVIYDLAKSDVDAHLTEVVDAIKKATDKAIANGYKVYGLSGSDPMEMNDLAKDAGFNFEFLVGDSTTFKTMIRANPGLLVLNKATVVDKKGWRDAESLVTN